MFDLHWKSGTHLNLKKVHGALKNLSFYEINVH